MSLADSKLSGEMGLDVFNASSISLHASNDACAFSFEAVTITRNHLPFMRSKPAKEKLAS